MCVAEIGCGTGLVVQSMAGAVGKDGSVADMSAEQLKVAEANAAAAGLENLSFHAASACDTGLARASFDLVYSRFLMCHLTEPVKALAEMGALLTPGGILVCEDHDDGGIFSEPPTRSGPSTSESLTSTTAANGLKRRRKIGNGRVAAAGRWEILISGSPTGKIRATTHHRRTD
jgi:ubiquinone/menaquinone biosynthesis C-methylase UbiE